MKTIQITKREQYVLMTVARAAFHALKSMSTDIGTQAMTSLLSKEPPGGATIPSTQELESILERLSSNDEE